MAMTLEARYEDGRGGLIVELGKVLVSGMICLCRVQVELNQLLLSPRHPCFVSIRHCNCLP